MRGLAVRGIDTFISGIVDMTQFYEHVAYNRQGIYLQLFKYLCWLGVDILCVCVCLIFNVTYWDEFQTLDTISIKFHTVNDKNIVSYMIQKEL